MVSSLSQYICVFFNFKDRWSTPSTLSLYNQYVALAAKRRTTTTNLQTNKHETTSHKFYLQVFMPQTTQNEFNARAESMTPVWQRWELHDNRSTEVKDAWKSLARKKEAMIRGNTTLWYHICVNIFENKGIKVVFSCISSNFKRCGNLRELYYKYRQDIKVLIATGMYRISGYMCK